MDDRDDMLLKQISDLLNEPTTPSSSIAKKNSFNDTKSQAPMTVHNDIIISKPKLNTITSPPETISDITKTKPNITSNPQPPETISKSDITISKSNMMSKSKPDISKTPTITGKHIKQYVIFKYLSNQTLSSDKINDIEKNIFAIKYDDKSECMKAKFIKDKYLTDIDYVKKILSELYKELISYMNNSEDNKQMLDKKKAELALVNIISSISKILLKQTNDQLCIEYIDYMSEVTTNSIRQTINLLKQHKM